MIEALHLTIGPARVHGPPLIVSGEPSARGSCGPGSLAATAAYRVIDSDPRRSQDEAFESRTDP